MKRLKKPNLYHIPDKQDNQKNNNLTHIDINSLHYFCHMPLISLPQNKINDILQNIVE